MRTATTRLLALAAGITAACSTGPADESNPWLEDQSNLGKEDTQYQNPDGLEVEVDLEADVEASAWQLPEAPAQLGQFAMTYLRKRGEFYLESLAEDATSDTRVEWLVDGAWITAAEARSVDTSKLRHFRIRAVNAVLLFDYASGAATGKVFTAKVPIRPYSIYGDAGDTCAEADGHISLGQSTYWYLWDPDRSGCKATLQDMTLTIARLLPAEKPTYPEYDQLVADGKVTAVILFGKIGDGDIETDIGMYNMQRFARNLEQGGFTEITPAPVGRRFSKRVAQVDMEIDLYSPKDFSGLGDYAHFDNLQKAISEHEIVAYDGHSMLGASDFWARPQYPDFYQIYLYGGCLGYEYYVRPILDGKGGWDKVDILSSVVEVSADANAYAAPFLAKMRWALEHDYNASWKDYIVAIRQRVGDSTFGVSGVRENCFSPGGSLCGGEGPEPADARRYTSSGAVAIPDNDPAGATSSLTVPDSIAGKITVELDISHTYVGDLEITLSHGDTRWTVWSRQGGSAQDIQQSFVVDAFAGQDAQGEWTLFVVDRAARDAGTINGWTLVVEP